MIKNISKIISLLFVIIFSNLAFSQDVILDALKSESDRAINKLEIQGSEKPYHICYTVYDTRKVDIEAAYGGITRSRNRLGRNGMVDVRVGDYSMDNTNYSNSFLAIRNGSFQLPINDDPFAIKYELWLVTDAQFKTSIDEFSQKKAGIQNRTFSEKVDDFSKEKSVSVIEDKNNYDIDVRRLEDKAVRYSAVFKNYPHIQTSSVVIDCEKGNEYFVNSEGTKIRKPINRFKIEVVATAIDKKGNRYSDYIVFFAASQEELPADIDADKAINQLAKNLQTLLAAPLADDYVGPVLFKSEASANFFSQVLSKSLSGKPAILTPGSIASQFIRKLGRKILPDFISIYDDPTVEEYNGTKLLGNYKIDDEGVPAQKVSIIENGVLKNLLMCRKPTAKVLQSNGHGRKGLNKRIDARPGNVFITAAQTKSYDELKKDLIKMCKDMDLEYGLIVKKMSDVAVFYNNVANFSSLLPTGKNTELFVSYPLEVYKVFVKDGKEELVRGYNFANLNLKILKDIVAVGSDDSVYNFENKGASGDLRTSFIAPSVILDDVEMNAEKDQNKRPFIMKHPIFSNK